jgi:hypothetical protein
MKRQGIAASSKKKSIPCSSQKRKILLLCCRSWVCQNFHFVVTSFNSWWRDKESAIKLHSADLWQIHGQYLETKVEDHVISNKESTLQVMNQKLSNTFFDCHLSLTAWRPIYLAFYIIPPCGVSNIFGPWLRGVDKAFHNVVKRRCPIQFWHRWLVSAHCETGARIKISRHRSIRCSDSQFQLPIKYAYHQQWTTTSQLKTWALAWRAWPRLFIDISGIHLYLQESATLWDRCQIFLSQPRYRRGNIFRLWPATTLWRA